MTSISGAGKREMPSSCASDRRQSAEPGPHASTAASAAASVRQRRPAERVHPIVSSVEQFPRRTRLEIACRVGPTAQQLPVGDEIALAGRRSSAGGVAVRQTVGCPGGHAPHDAPAACNESTRNCNESVPLQARIDGLGLQGQDAEDALVHAAQRLAAHEALQRLDAQRELARGQRALAAQAARAQALELAGRVYSGP